MREIKFREYRGDGKWHYWGLMEEGKFVGPCSPNSKAFQLTGLTDTKGNAVWEGDIIKYIVESCDNEIGVVRFSNQGFWTTSEQGLHEELLSEELDFKPFESEVIGNIYENKELLK